MEFKKNQIVELYIDDIGNEGEGIGHIDGYALFLKDAVIGDKVRAKIIKTKKNYGCGAEVSVRKTMRRLHITAFSL